MKIRGSLHCFIAWRMVKLVVVTAGISPMMSALIKTGDEAFRTKCSSSPHFVRRVLHNRNLISRTKAQVVCPTSSLFVHKQTLIKFTKCQFSIESAGIVMRSFCFIRTMYEHVRSVSWCLRSNGATLHFIVHITLKTIFVIKLRKSENKLKTIQLWHPRGNSLHSAAAWILRREKTFYGCKFEETFFIDHNTWYTAHLISCFEKRMQNRGSLMSAIASCPDGVRVEVCECFSEVNESVENSKLFLSEAFLHFFTFVLLLNHSTRRFNVTVLKKRDFTSNCLSKVLSHLILAMWLILIVDDGFLGLWNAERHIFIRNSE